MEAGLEWFIDQRVQWFPGIAVDEDAADAEANVKGAACKDEDHKGAAHERTSTEDTEHNSKRRGVGTTSKIDRVRPSD